jgi:hypothetical protein
VLLLAGVCLLAVIPFHWLGNPSGHDFEFHVYSWMEVLGQWKHSLNYPRWAGMAHFGYGEPRFLFYPPLSWALGAALGAVLPWSAAPAAYCWIVLTLPGVSMFRLARHWLRRKDALFAALLYALNPYHLLIVYWRSAYAELMAAALIPLVLVFLLLIEKATLQRLHSSGAGFAAERVKGQRPFLQAAAGLSLTLASAWLTNLPAAVMIHYSVAGLVIFFGLRVLIQEPTTRRLSRDNELLRPFLSTVAAILLGIGLASFYLLPAVYEQRWINISEVLSPGVRPQDNFLFTTLADADHNRFNLLVSVLATIEIVVLILAIVMSWRHRIQRTRFALAGPVPGRVARSPVSEWSLLSVWGLACAFLMLSPTNFLWQHLPKLRFVQLPFRWLLCLNAALAVLVAMAARRWISRLALSAVLLITLLTAGHLIQPPWWDTNADIREMTDFMENNTGYEGADEYVPLGADASELNKDLPRITDESGNAILGKILTWQAEEIHFVVHSNEPKNIVVRLFDYPAWAVTVNSNPVDTARTETTGLMLIPIAAGENNVDIRFRRTVDRTVGIIISLISFMLLVLVWIYGQRGNLPSRRIQTKFQTNTSAGAIE